MTTNTKRCTGCSETKPLNEFHLRSRKMPEGPRRARCKTCSSAERRRRAEGGLSVTTQIMRHAVDPTFKLSPEAEAVVYSDEPLDPELVRKAQARLKAWDAEKRRLEREAKRARDLRPMRFSQQECFR